MTAFHRHMARTLLFGAGVLALILAVIGTLLPIMPTVPFLLLAIACFSRSSKRMHTWILSLPGVGKELHAWEVQGAVSLRAKIWASGTLIGLVAIPMFFRQITLWLKLLALATVVGVLVFLWSRPRPH